MQISMLSLVSANRFVITNVLSQQPPLPPFMSPSLKSHKMLKTVAFYLIKFQEVEARPESSPSPFLNTFSPLFNYMALH